MAEKKTPREIVDELTYRNYAYNREKAPAITPEQWAKVYGDTTTLETRYQEEGYPAHMVEVALW